MVVGVLPDCGGGNHSFWKKGKLLVGVGSLRAPKKRERWWRLGQGKTGLVKEGGQAWVSLFESA